jgi:hypothetical protein
MHIIVDVVVAPQSGSDRPGAGTPTVVELRDTGVADAKATTIAVWTGVLGRTGGGPIATAEFHVEPASLDPKARLTVWARCAASGSPRKTKGDWITMESVPVDLAAADDPLRIVAPVRRI